MGAVVLVAAVRRDVECLDETVGVRMILEDGSHHAADSSEMAAQLCGRDAFREPVRQNRLADTSAFSRLRN